VTLEEIRVEIDEIHLAGDHNAVRLTTTISRDDFDDAVPNTLAKRERQEWIDDHADALADLMVKKYERGESVRTYRGPSPIENVNISSAELQAL
jgi:hypothetical protein